VIKYNNKIMKKKLRIIFFIVILFIGGLYLLFRMQPKKENGEEIEKTEIILPPEISLEAKKLDIKTASFLNWLNNNDVVYYNGRQIFSLDINTLNSKSLLTLDFELKSLAVKNNLITIQEGLPFTQIKNYYVYRNNESKQLDLSDYEPVVSIFPSPFSNKVNFIGNFDVNKKGGNLYSYEIDSGKVDGPLLNNVPYSSIQWIDNNKALMYKFLDEQGGETLFLIDTQKKSSKTISSDIKALTSAEISPDKTRLLISGENNLIVKELENISQTKKLKSQSFYGFWVDSQNILLTPAKTSIEFLILNIDAKTERIIETPSLLVSKTLRTLIPSPTNEYALLRTEDNSWYLIKVTKK